MQHIYKKVKQLTNSNTTLVKVKFNPRLEKILWINIQIQHLLKLNSKGTNNLRPNKRIQIQHLLKLNIRKCN